MNALSFLSGITVTTFLASALFFFRFWKASRDSFFLYFSIACVLIALDRFIALYFQATAAPDWSSSTEATAWIYLIRLAAFVIIFFGIAAKNRSSSLPP